MLHRLLAGGFGLFLIGVAIYAPFFTGTSTILQIVGGFALVLCGGSMLVSACRGTESWLARL